MKIFLSWSGKPSRKVAIALRDWLPCIFQGITPFVSSEDLRKGKRWRLEMTGELEKAGFGLICLTRQNLESPWILFESGALSKSVSESYACTLLLDGLRPTDVVGPLSDFQHTTCEKGDFRKLLGSVNEALGEKGITDQLLNRLFEKFWPDLAAAVAAAFHGDNYEPTQNSRPERELLEEVLTLSRFIARNTVKPDAEKSITETENKLRKLLYLGIGEVGFEPRHVRMLEDIGIHNVGALASGTEAELRAHKGFKKKDVDQIDFHLRRMGLRLGMRFNESIWTNNA
jgi:hypothetical protein